MRRTLITFLLAVCAGFAQTSALGTDAPTHNTGDQASGTQSSGDSASTGNSATADAEAKATETPEEKEKREQKEKAQKLLDTLASEKTLSGDRTAEQLDGESKSMDEFISSLKSEDGSFNEKFAQAAESVLQPLAKELRDKLDALPAGSPERTALAQQLGRVTALQSFIDTSRTTNPVAIAQGPNAGPVSGPGGSNGTNQTVPGDLDVAGQFGGTVDPRNPLGTPVATAPAPSPAPLKSLPVPSPSVPSASPQTAPATTPSYVSMAATPKTPTIYQSSVAAVNKATSALESTFFKSETTATAAPVKAKENAVASATPTSAPQTKEAPSKEGVTTIRNNDSARPEEVATTASITPSAIPKTLAPVTPTSIAEASAPSTSIGPDEKFDFTNINPPLTPVAISTPSGRAFAPESPRGITTIESSFWENPSESASTSALSESVPTVGKEETESREIARENPTAGNTFAEFSRDVYRGFTQLKERLSAEETTVEKVADSTEPSPAEKPTLITSSSTPSAKGSSSAPSVGKSTGLLQFMNLMKRKAQEDPA